MKKSRILVGSVTAAVCAVAVLTVALTRETDPAVPEETAPPVAATAQTAAPALSDSDGDTATAGKASDAQLLAEREEFYAARGFDEGDRRVALDRQAAVDSADPTALKTYIYDRMLNTADYYTSVCGEYTRSGQDAYTVTYAVLAGEEHRTAEIRSGVDGVQAAYFDGYTARRVAEEDGVPVPYYSTSADIHEKELLDFVPLVASRARMQLDGEGTPTWYYREDLNLMTFCRECVSPQERAFGYLSDFSRWQVAGEDSVLERPCFVLTGTLAEDYAARQNAASFTLWVDEETGILVKWEQFDAAGRLVDQLTPRRLEVNADSRTVAAEIREVGDTWFSESV